MTGARGPAAPVPDRVDAFDWTAIQSDLDDVGVGLTPVLLDPTECGALIGLYDEATRFRWRPWPDDLDEWVEQCHRAGQTRPTPLMLRYETGDWNALHRDLYGDLVFPLQVVVGLDRPGPDFTGGEFVVVEQRPRAQSRATATEIPAGHALVFTTRDRPIRTTRGWSNVSVRHGLSTVRSGRRHALGLVFHDAK